MINFIAKIWKKYKILIALLVFISSLGYFHSINGRCCFKDLAMIPIVMGGYALISSFNLILEEMITIINKNASNN